MFLPSRYIPNPATEVVMFGDQLRDGMVVLFEDPILKAHTRLIRYDDPEDAMFRRAMETNRWCTVTNFRRDRDQIVFIGLYGDGTQIVRRVHMTHGWIVKRGTFAVEQAKALPA